MNISPKLKQELSKIASLGGKARWEKYTPEQRKLLMAKMTAKSVESRRKKKEERERLANEQQSAQ